MIGENSALLIVQEDQEFASAIAKIARRCGYEPRIILDSREFSRAYREALPAVIFMELFMPERDGMEMISWLIEEKSSSRVIMTAKQTPELAFPAVLLAKAAKLFTVTVLARPVSVEKIQAAIKEALLIS
jgi:DNA-binding NtrC family response regulator